MSQERKLAGLSLSGYSFLAPISRVTWSIENDIKSVSIGIVNSSSLLTVDSEQSTVNIIPVQPEMI